MKRTILFLLVFAVFTTATYGQHRDSRSGTALPLPSSTGTVTLSLAEYNRLMELAALKPKVAEAAPLPFVLSRAAFKLRVADQSLTGALDIEGSVLEKGSVRVPLVSGLTILEAKQANSPLPLLQEGRTHSAIINGPSAFAVTL